MANKMITVRVLSQPASTVIANCVLVTVVTPTEMLQKTQRSQIGNPDKINERMRQNILKSSTYNIIYNKPTRCNSGSIVFIKIYKYALHVSDALCVHLQEHYKL